MEKCKIIYDHYKESCEICRNNEKDRNKLFTFVCFLLTLLYLFMIAEASMLEIIYVWLKEKYDFDLVLSVGTIQSSIWVLLLYFTIRYFQQCINIERLYQYIHSLEEQISDDLNFNFTREGQNYLQEYPAILNFIWVIYTIVFPALNFVVVVVKIIVEIHESVSSWNLFIHVVLGACDAILTLLYFYFLHKDMFKKLFHYSR